MQKFVIAIIFLTAAAVMQAQTTHGLLVGVRPHNDKCGNRRFASVTLLLSQPGRPYGKRRP